MSLVESSHLKTMGDKWHWSNSVRGLFLQMVASKFLYDEGVDEEVYNEEWAESAAMETADVNQLERDFLTAIVSFVLWSKSNINIT